MNTRRRRLVIGVALVAAAAVTGLAMVINHQDQAGQTSHAAPVPRPLVTSQDTSRAATPSQDAGGSIPPTSGTPAPTIVVSPAEPTQLFIPTIGVNTSIGAGKSALEWDDRVGKSVLNFPVPPDLTTVTWWEGGPNPAESVQFAPAPKPGDAGVAIMTMHASLGNKGYGVGNRLSELKRGEKVGVEGRGTGSQKLLLTFTVLKVRTHLDKADLNALADAIRGAPKGTRLILVTCSGSVNDRLSSSNFNTVVYAALKSSAKA